MALETKLLKACGNYPTNYFSAGRYLLLAAMPEKFGLTLDDEELEEIGGRIRNRINEDFHQCIYPATNILLSQEYKTRLIHLDDLCAGRPQTEYELLEVLANRKISGMKLTETAKKTIKDVKNGLKNGFSHMSIDMLFMDEECLQNSTRNNESLPISYVMFRKKTDISLVLKFMSRLKKFYEMDKDDYNAITVGEKSSIDEIRKYTFEYLVAGMKSGENFYDFLYNAGKHRNFGGPYNNLVGDLILIDGAGVKICAPEREITRLGKKLETTGNHLLDILPSRCENFLSSGEKDKSIVYGIRGSSQSNYGEVRLQVVRDNYEGEFGERAHFRYKAKELRELKDALQKHSELNLAFYRLCSTFGLQRNEVLM